MVVGSIVFGPRITSSETSPDRQVRLRKAFQKDGHYELVPPRSDAKGIQCGECGSKFDYGKAYGFVCGNINCPVQSKVT